MSAASQLATTMTATSVSELFLTVSGKGVVVFDRKPTSEDPRSQLIAYLCNADPSSFAEALSEVSREAGSPTPHFAGSISDLRDRVASAIAAQQHGDEGANFTTASATTRDRFIAALSPVLSDTVINRTPIAEKDCKNGISNNNPLRTLLLSSGGGADEQGFSRAAKLVEDMLTNNVRKCGHCSKPNAYTLSVCNQCGSTDLATTPITRTNNVFMGFILGVALAPPFPLQISLRQAPTDDNNTLVIDDLLGLSPLHVNAIPTAEYIPDWRYLLRRPQQGLAVVQRLKASVCNVATTQFLSKSKWCKTFINQQDGYATFVAEKDLMMGFNFPPSQAQLHLQCIAPLMLPFQYAQYLRDVHFTAQRFFPVQYVLDLLIRITDDANMVEFLPAHLLHQSDRDGDDNIETPPLAAKRRMRALHDLLLNSNFTPNNNSSEEEDFVPTIEDIITFAMVQYGLDNAMYHSSFIKQVEVGQGKFASWTPGGHGFKGVVVSSMPAQSASSVESTSIPDVYLPFATSSSEQPPPAPKVLVEADKLTLQAYGRPYHPGTQKPSGSYNPNPRPLDSIDVW